MSNEEIRNKAYEYYQAGLKYKEIAEKCGVTISAVKSWAARYWKKKSCNQEDEKLQPKKKKVATRGAPKGNRYAAGNRGGSAPQGNKNALTTGEFETLLFDCLDEEEKKLVQGIGGSEHKTPISKIELEEGKIVQVIDGPLKEYVGNVVRVNLHKREVAVRVVFMGRDLELKMGIEMVGGREDRN